MALRDAGKTWTNIARYLNAKGHVTRDGGAWTIHSVQRLVRRENKSYREQRHLALKSFKAVVGSRDGTAASDRRRGDRLSSSPKAVLPVVEVKPGAAIIYCRVSSHKQGRSGYSLDAQREITHRFCKENQLLPIETYTEVERAWRTRIEQRPKLLKAISHAKATGAKIVISRLDRLTRNISVVTKLMESGVAFVAADAPFANHLTLLLLAAAAQEESRLISARMKDVRATAKASRRDWRHVCNLRREHREEGVRRSAEIRRCRTRDRYAFVEPIAKTLRESGLSLARIATNLNGKGLRTQRGTPWTDVSTLNLLRRIGAAPPHRSSPTV